MAGQMLEFAVNLSMLTSGNISQGTAAASKSLTELQSKMQSLNKTGSMIQSFQKQQSSLEGLRTKLVAAREKVRVMREELRKTDSPSAALQKRFAQAQKEAGLLGAKFQEQREKLATLNSELLKSGINTSKLSSEQNKLVSQTDRVKAAQDRLTAAQDRYNSLRSKVYDWNNLKSTVITSMAAFKALEAPVKLAADFESAMARVQAVGFTNGEDLDGLKAMTKQALELGAATKFTAVEAARAQEMLIRGGMTPTQTMQAMTGTLNMAAAEGMSIDEAASIIAKGLGGMQLEAKLAPRYADVLAYTSSKSNTDIRAISEAMRIAAPVASSQNIPLEKIASYIGVLANKGFEGSEVGTAISSSISRLAKRPKQAQDALNALGIKVMTKSGGLVELPNIMKQLSEKLDGMGELKQQEYLSRIFGQFAPQMMALMSAVTSGEQQRLQAGTYTESFGWSGKQSAINLNTLNGQLDILKSSWDGLRITVGEMFSPVVRKGVEMLSDALSGLNKILTDFPTVSKGFMYFISMLAAGKAVTGVYSLSKAILTLPKAWLDVKLAEHAANLATMGANAGTLATNMGGAAKSAGLFGVSLNTALGYIGLIVTASILIYENWDKIKGLWSDLTGPKIELPSIQTGGAKIPQWQTEGGIILRPSPSRNADMSTTEEKMSRAKRMMGGRNKMGWTPHAKGGIMTTPHFGLVAESGPEAIIPLRDKTRGLEVMSQTMNLLGVNNALVPPAKGGYRGVIFPQQSPYAGEAGNQGAFFNRGSIFPGTQITINVTGSNDTDIASRIKSAVLDALEEISSYRERVAYA